jgi:predicted nucleotidyltransferase
VTGAPVDRDRLQAAAAEVGRDEGLRLVVLFGSAARPGARGEDLDLGVLGSPLPAQSLDVVAITNRLIQLLGVQHVDVADLGRADPVLLAHAARDGVPLYEGAPGEFGRFVSLAVRRFADTRKFRVGERDAIREYVARERKPR